MLLKSPKIRSEYGKKEVQGLKPWVLQLLLEIQRVKRNQQRMKWLVRYAGKLESGVPEAEWKLVKTAENVELCQL